MTPPRTAHVDTARPTTFEEAAAAQIALWKRREAGESIPDVRTASLRDGYGLRPVGHVGTGLYAVNAATGEPCACVFKWDPTGEVLLCERCFLDGT